MPLGIHRENFHLSRLVHGPEHESVGVFRIERWLEGAKPSTGLIVVVDLVY